MIRLVRHVLLSVKSLARRLSIQATGLVLPYLPVRVLFTLAILAQVLRLRGQRIFLLHLISATAKRSRQEAVVSLSRNDRLWMPKVSSRVLYAAGRHQDAIRAVRQLRPGARTKETTLLMARALFE